MRHGGRLALPARVLEPPTTADELVPLLGPGSKPLDRPHHLLLRGFGGDRRGGRESLTFGDRRGADAVARGRRTPSSSAVAAATSTFVVLVSPSTTERSSLSTGDVSLIRSTTLERERDTINFPTENEDKKMRSFRTTPLDDRRPSLPSTMDASIQKDLSQSREEDEGEGTKSCFQGSRSLSRRTTMTESIPRFLTTDAFVSRSTQEPVLHRAVHVVQGVLKI